METQQKYVLTPIAGAVAAALSPGSGALAQDDDDQAGLEEIIVTATKREVSIQDIPASIQAITQESLAAMGARTLEDYARFVPSVNVVSYGSGQSTVVFRGAITGSGWLAQATSSVYLDEISITQTGSQPTIRSVDIERIEALSGPQGTLYGSDAQAGTLRIITNQPVMNEFEAVLDAELRGASEGDSSYRGSLVFNVPLVEDKLAMRVVGFSDRDGGFIDNVYGRTADWHGPGDRSDPANNFAPAGFGTLDNAASVEKNWNEDEVYGGRIHLRWEMNDDWAATASYHYQKADAGADAAMDLFVGDLETIRFHDNWREEEFSMSSLKIEGDLGFGQLVAAVSYYDREYESMSDMTTYVHYWAALYCHDSAYTPDYYDDNPYYPYYTIDSFWANPDTGYIVWWPVYCAGESVDADYLSVYYEPAKEDKLTAEIRLQGSGEVFEWIVGGYYEESTDWWGDPFHAPTPGGRVNDQYASSLYQDSISLQFWEWYHGEEFPTATQNWTAGQNTDWEQTAIFGEMTWHVNDSLDLTVGGRYFDRTNVSAYWVNHPGRQFYDEGAIAAGNDDEYREANGGRPLGRKGEETQFAPKVSLSYKFGEDKMIYGLYTEGVRQGGVNRSRGEPFFPNQYDSDLMKNHEAGYRSSFADGRGRLNLSLYHMAWEEYQLQTRDPSFVPCIDPDTGEEDPQLSIPQVCGQPWQTIIANLGEAHITGYNVSLDYAPNDNWVLGFNYENMEAETDSAHDLDGDDVPDLVKGMRLPLTPDYKASAWIEYHQPINFLGANDFFVRAQWSSTGESLSRLEPFSPLDSPFPQFVNPGYDIGDLRVGLVGDDWQVDMFVNNVTDERAIYSYDSGPPIVYQAAQISEGRLHHLDAYVNRPREFGVRFMKRWGD
jgi:outer membrane receptor protein involved in Fe transport